MSPKLDTSSLAVVFQGANLLVMIIAIVGATITLGKRDAQIGFNQTAIGELRLIASDLVKSQVLSEANDSTHAAVLEELKRRVERLERPGT